MKAYPFLWNSQEKHKNQIFKIGTFHIIMANFRMIGKKTAVLLELGMIATGPMTGVMNEKNYSRALNYPKTLAEAIFRLLLNNFIEEHELLNNSKLLPEGFCIMLIKIGGSFL